MYFFTVCYRSGGCCLLFPCSLTNTPWLSWQSCWVSGFQRFRPARTASGSRALCFLAGMSPCSLLPSYRQLCESPGRLVLATPRGSAAHRFVWAAGWHAAPRVLIWCQLFSISPYPPPSYFAPQLVYTQHPPTESKKMRESLMLLVLLGSWRRGRGLGTARGSWLHTVRLLFELLGQSGEPRVRWRRG